MSAARQRRGSESAEASDLYERLTAAFAAAAAVGLRLGDDGGGAHAYSSHVTRYSSHAALPEGGGGERPRAPRVAWDDVRPGDTFSPVRGCSEAPVGAPSEGMAMCTDRGGVRGFVRGGATGSPRAGDFGKSPRSHATSGLYSPVAAASAGGGGGGGYSPRASTGAGNGSSLADVTLNTSHTLAFLGPLAPVGRNTNDAYCKARAAASAHVDVLRTAAAREAHVAAARAAEERQRRRMAARTKSRFAAAERERKAADDMRRLGHAIDVRHLAAGRAVREAEATRRAEGAAADAKRRQAAHRAACDEAVHARNAAALALTAMEATGVLFSGAFYTCRECNEGRACGLRGAPGHAPVHNIGTPRSPPERAHAYSLGPYELAPHARGIVE